MNRRKIIDNPDAEKIFHLYYDLIERLFNKAKKGELDYQSDMRKLDQYLARAERAGIGDEMHGLILNHKGLICSMSGRTKEGNAFYQQGHDWFRQLDDIHGVMMVTTNYASNLYDDGDYQGVAEVMQQVYVESVDAQGYPAITALYGLATAHYRLGNYGDIEPYVEALVAGKDRYLHENPQMYAQSFANIHQVLARVALRKGNIDRAEALQLAADEHLDPNYYYLVAYGKMVYGYICNLRQQQAEALLKVDEAIHYIEAAKSPVQAASFYLEEAEEALHFDLPATALEFAQRALPFYEDCQMEKNIARCQAVIKAAPQA